MAAGRAWHREGGRRRRACPAARPGEAPLPRHADRRLRAGSVDRAPLRPRHRVGSCHAGGDRSAAVRLARTPGAAGLPPLAAMPGGLGLARIRWGRGAAACAPDPTADTGSPDSGLFARRRGARPEVPLALADHVWRFGAASSPDDLDGNRMIAVRSLVTGAPLRMELQLEGSVWSRFWPRHRPRWGGRYISATGSFHLGCGCFRTGWAPPAFQPSRDGSLPLRTRLAPQPCSSGATGRGAAFPATRLPPAVTASGIPHGGPIRGDAAEAEGSLPEGTVTRTGAWPWRAAASGRDRAEALPRSGSVAMRRAAVRLRSAPQGRRSAALPSAPRRRGSGR